jgi:selenide,water dikinase
VTTTTETAAALSRWTTCGGCAAKWGAGPLRELVGSLVSAPADGSLLVGLDGYDDAAVLRLTDDLALVSTTDFFPPMVDDPADFGAIAAANALSDVYAMGGRVVLALNLAAFPEDLDPAVISAVIRSAAAVVTEAGGVVAGGHTIRSDQPIFGLAVQGLVHPDRILTKGGAVPGDVLVLSKPLGTGIVLQGGDPAERAATVTSMKQLNRAASAALVELGSAVHAATDVTGYGLAGHGFEMAERSGARLDVDMASVPLYPGALRLAGEGVRTGGDPRNRQALVGRIESATTEPLEALAFDPQTSGGLLAAVEPGAVPRLADAGFAPIGRVAAGDPGVTLR